MKRYVKLILNAAFCLAWAGVIACVVLRLDVGGHWSWMLSVSAAMLMTLLQLLIWLWRLYRWRPALLEVLCLLASVMLLCWEFRGFGTITWYELDVSCSSGVKTTPTWHVSPWKRAYMSVCDDWSIGRFGDGLVANSIEYHWNYHPRVGHGPCAVSFSHYEGVIKGIQDAFTLDLPQEAAPTLQMRLDASSSAIGVIVSRGDGAGAYARYLESQAEPQQWCEKEAYLWLPASPGGVLELPADNGRVTFYIVYCPGVEENAPEGISPYSVLPFRISRK